MTGLSGTERAPDSEPTSYDPPRLSGHNSDFIVERVPTVMLKLDDHSARLFSARDQKAATRAIKRFGIQLPLIVDDTNTVIVGTLFLLAAQKLGLADIPVRRLTHMRPVELRALSVAYARVGELGAWDKEKLGTLMLQFETEMPDFELEDLAFEVPHIDMMIGETDTEAGEDELEEPQQVAISVVGDVWRLGDHRLLCGDASLPSSYQSLMAGVSAKAVFTDPPFGCEINGFVAGTGRHREFVMGSGEMNEDELRSFFAAFNTAMAEHLKPGAVIYEVIDWRSLHLLLDAATPVFGKLINMAIWVKDRAGMGSFLRSQHELILIFKAKGGRARNNVELGKHGRHRSNIWSYPSAMTASKGSDEGNMLANHSTPKCVRMVADALLDCTKRGDVVLDPFLGSGTTLIAADKVGRICYGMDLDPLYVDLIVRRWQAWTGDEAVHAVTGETFNAWAAAVLAAEGASHG